MGRKGAGELERTGEEISRFSAISDGRSGVRGLDLGVSVLSRLRSDRKRLRKYFRRANSRALNEALPDKLRSLPSWMAFWESGVAQVRAVAGPALGPARIDPVKGKLGGKQ
jgi:hypothetical protein